MDTKTLTATYEILSTEIKANGLTVCEVRKPRGRKVFLACLRYGATRWTIIG